MRTQPTEMLWTATREYTQDDLTLTVLQRDLSVEGDKYADLEPFFSLPTLMKHACYGSSALTIRGNVLDVEFTEENLKLNVRDSTHGQTLDWVIDRVKSMTLTVWRVNNRLDALQVLLIGDNSAVYLQTGGERLVELFGTPPAAPSDWLAEPRNLFLRQTQVV